MTEETASTTETRVEPVVEAPNGRPITMRDLHAFMYVKDQADAKSFNIVLEQVGQVRKEFATHVSDGHPFVNQGEIIKAEINRDAAKAGVAAKWLGLGLIVAGAIAGFVVSAAKGWLGIS